MKKLYFLLIFSILLLSSCFKEKFLNNPHLRLKFETDTVFFDTVFTQIGSATRIFKVYNPYNSAVKIDKIFLAGGKNSPFRLNINGLPGLQANDVIIPARDSIFLFVDVTINPEKSNYLLVLDSVVFDIAGSLQSVKLMAVGWTVHLIRRQIIEGSQTWDSQMPYLIFDYVIVDTNACLNIQPGTKIFLHRGAVVYVLGCLKSNGLLDSTVVFATDRLEQDYRQVPGQWGGIVLDRISQGNFFNYTEIRNSTVGISIDSVQDTVRIYNCKIEHQSYANVFAASSNVVILNSLLDDAGWYNVGFIKGGNYTLIHNTIANYYGWGTIRTTPAVAVTNYQMVNGQAVYWQPIKLTIANSIIYGSLENELILSAANEWENFDYMIKNSLVKTKEPYQMDSCIVNQDPKFVDIEKFDFHLDSLSPAINKASREIINLYPQVLENDLDGQSRLSDSSPDIGAYEFVLE